MTRATPETFGVTSTVLSAYLPQLGFGASDDAFTDVMVTTVIAGEAARVCLQLLSAGLDPSDIAAETSSAAYLQLRRIIAMCCLPSVARAMSGLGTKEIAAIDQMAKTARADLDHLIAHIGTADDAAQGSPRVRTPGLPTDAVTRKFADYADSGKKYTW